MTVQMLCKNCKHFYDITAKLPVKLPVKPICPKCKEKGRPNG